VRRFSQLKKRQALLNTLSKRTVAKGEVKEYYSELTDIASKLHRGSD
jgi:hypothetical protein